MKAELTNDGYIKITAETIAESFALKHILPIDSKCGACGLLDYPIEIDASMPKPPEPKT